VPLLRRLWRLHEGPVTTRVASPAAGDTTAETGPGVRGSDPVYTAGLNPHGAGKPGGCFGCLLATDCSARYRRVGVLPAIDEGAAELTGKGRDVELSRIHDLKRSPRRPSRPGARRPRSWRSTRQPRTYAQVIEARGFEAAKGRRPDASRQEKRNFARMAAAVPTWMGRTRWRPLAAPAEIQPRSPGRRDLRSRGRDTRRVRAPPEAGAPDAMRWPARSSSTGPERATQPMADGQRVASWSTKWTYRSKRERLMGIYSSPSATRRTPTWHCATPSPSFATLPAP